VSVRVEVALQPGQGKARRPVRDLVKAVLSAERAGGLVVVAFVDEPQMTELNGRFRGLDTSTDVLSFRQADSGVDWPDPTKGRAADLGEVIICLAVVERYAQEEGGNADTQVGWTIQHGVLHLLGYDHENDSGEMRAREQVLLGELDRQVRAVGKALGG
jgi:probable rRNA maturation factor